MPIRNSFLILFVAVVSFASYNQAQRNRFATLYAEATERISTNYVEQVNRRELFESAMQGMLENLDPYSSYIIIPASDRQGKRPAARFAIVMIGDVFYRIGLVSIGANWKTQP